MLYPISLDFFFYFELNFLFIILIIGCILIFEYFVWERTNSIRSFSIRAMENLFFSFFSCISVPPSTHSHTSAKLNYTNFQVTAEEFSAHNFAALLCAIYIYYSLKKMIRLSPLLNSYFKWKGFMLI